MLSRLKKDERGEDIIEYGFLTALISIAAIGILRLFSGPIEYFYTAVLNAVHR
jgi:Flp pilus assembly pilin Flp